VTTKAIILSPKWHAIITKLKSVPNLKYDIGKKQGQGKVHNLKSTLPETIRGLDCSGFTQYVFFSITNQHLAIPQGSYTQAEYFKKQNYAEVKYALAGVQDNVLRIAFRRTKWGPKPTEGKRKKIKPGHVWFILNGLTYECTKKGGQKYGSNGIKPLPWHLRTAEAHTCFEIGDVSLEGSVIALPLFGSAMPSLGK